MREIKFRVWNDRHKEFAYWGFIGPGFTGIPTGSGITIEDCQKLSQQFTGQKLNTQDVYEGDLISMHTFIYVVCYEDAAFVLYHVKNDYGKWGDLCRLFDLDFSDYKKEIIGNIYSNPELIKSE